MEFRMRLNALFPLLAAIFLAGCSTYDVLAHTADAVLSLTGINDDKKRSDDDYIGIWDPDVSSCIQLEYLRRDVVADLEAFEEGKDYVILPTGELYPVERHSFDEVDPGVTRQCLEKH